MTEEKRLNNEKKFIEKVIKIHRDKYDYSKVSYINAITKVEIICSEHGSFWQTPDIHSRGSGCNRCTHNFTPSNDELLEQFAAIHKNKYDYSLVNYVSSYEKVKIICATHGEFEQLPGNHKQGQGCPTCAGKNLDNSKLIDQFNKYHNYRYDYSKVNYKNDKEKITIICKEHGEFIQSPGEHKRGTGCSKCGKNYNYTTEEIILRFKYVHSDQYDYSLVEYNRIFNKVDIICSIHGIFSQTSADHLSGCGCPKCKESKGERRIREYLESKNINYIQEYRVEILHEETTYNHRFDFYLPDYNTYIEYDGIQHFEPVEYFGGEEALQNTQFKDSLKDLFCENNNFKIIRIPYWDFGNIENHIQERLTNV